jgi:LysM repeat protein
MKRVLYRLLLPFLRLAILGKRALHSFGVLSGRFFSRTYAWYRKTIGFHLYKLTHSWQKQVDRPFWGTFTEAIASRRTLEIALFAVAFLFTVPKSQFVRFDSTMVPGRNTLLFAFAGPGDQDFTQEDVVIDVTALGAPDEFSWRNSAVRADSGTRNTTDDAVNGPYRDVVTRSGATALMGQVIMPGATLGGTAETTRREIVYHEVQTGEVLGSISEAYGINLETLLAANNLTLRSYIRPGDRLVILPVNGLTHTVKKGDTVSKIASIYNAKAEDIVGFNELPEEGKAIAVGDVLIVPGGRRTIAISPTPSPRPGSSGTITTRPSTASPAAAVGGYIWPTNVRRVTQYYGLRHTGMDIAGPVGSPLYASKGGKVIRSQCGYNGGYGCHIILDHGGGITTLYGHASQLFVKVGDEVSQGEVIAFMGSTGRSTGPHIHFEVRVSGRKTNPLQYIK